ncbi:zinc ribbon domain-containing protein [Sulfobacillus thermosulfidooxidans]|uniref:zinc ribbon domain-containing protein n=1 Tax=Sulfobacillus thermosulfidooxidans TaxID=28034 RepID=UPI0009EB50D9|nr:zinc ribbon domain-containing protein [Sulfobacillus thermosulfidooxidans]
MMPDWKSLKDKALSAVNNAAQEVDYQLTLTKLRAQVKSDQNRLAEAYQHLGRACHELLVKTGSVSRQSETVAPLLMTIAQCEETLKQSQKSLEDALSVENKTTCPACGAAISQSARFCPSCGNPLT